MTKEEAFNKYKNTKVYVDGKSKEIQEKLFQIGFKWTCGGDSIMNEDLPFLFTENVRNSMTAGFSMEDFKENPNREVSANEILNATIRQESQKLKTFDKVLVRDSYNHSWEPTFFHKVLNNTQYPYKTIGSESYRFCIPYTGNEDLLEE